MQENKEQQIPEGAGATMAADAHKTVDQAHDILTKDAPIAMQGASLDELADTLLIAMGRFIGKSVANPNFCGFKVEEGTRVDGEAAHIKFIACEKIGENLAKVGS